ncbi:MAG: undecaprenyl-diphosphatase UppP, partial [Nitrospirota bacterium]
IKFINMVAEAILLGIVQGITEFLPISSSAHLILIPWFFGWNNTLIDTLSFDVALHFGTFMAVIVYFRDDWKRLATAFFKSLSSITKYRRNNSLLLTMAERLVWFIIIGTIPAGIAGILFEDIIERSFRSPILITVTLVTIGILMIFVEFISKRQKHLSVMTFSDSFFVALAQCLALIPGVSRSGITITAGLLKNYSREASARFSFLLATPIIAGAAAYKLRYLLSGIPEGDLIPFIAGAVTSAITGYYSIGFLLKYLQEKPLNLFSYYRFLLAAIIVLRIKW